MELDQFMKELMGDFAKEVIDLFFPRLAQCCDFSQMKELNKDLYTDSPKGSERFVDVLLEIKYKNPPISYSLEKYLNLTEEENQIYEQIIKDLYPEVNEMLTNPLIEKGRKQGWKEGLREGRQEGFREGRQEGRQEGIQESVIMILMRRFHQIPQDLQNKIYSVNDTDKLKKILDASFSIQSLDELTKNGLFSK